jgi:ribosomal protein L22
MTDFDETPEETPEEDVSSEAASGAGGGSEASSEVPEATSSSEAASRASSDEPTSDPSGSPDEEEQEPEATVDEPDEPEEPAVKPPAPPRRVRRRRRGAEAADEAPAVPEKPAPAARRRPRRDPSLPAPVVRAQAKYVRSSPRKARLVCDNIRGKSVEEARAILAHTPRAIARDWSKLLESAVANAEHNHELVGEDLLIKSVTADAGPTIKRFRPRAMGRATKIRKRTSHLTILLTPKD